MKLLTYQCDSVKANEATRRLLGVSAGVGFVFLKSPTSDRKVSVSVEKTSVTASKIDAAVQAQFGVHLIGITDIVASQLGINFGDIVEANNTDSSDESASASDATNSADVEPEIPAPNQTLRQILEGLGLGCKVVLSESAVKSRVYSVAKEIGIKIKKISATVVERVE